MKMLALPSWFTAFLAKYRRSVIVALLLGLVSSACAALLMFTSGYLISATAQPGILLLSVMVPVACVQLFGAGRPLARYLERLVSHDWVLRVTSDLRLSLYEGIAARIDDPARARATGEYLGMLADDIAHLQNLYLRVVFPSAIAYMLAIGASVLFGCFSVPFALLVLLVLAITAFALPYATLLATRALSFAAKEEKSREFASLTDDVLGSTDWVLSNRSRDAVDRHLADGYAMRKADARIRMRERALSLCSTLVMGAAVCAVLVWAGGAFGNDPSTANLIAAFALGFFPLIEAFAVLPAAAAQVPVHASALERLDGYLDGEKAAPRDGTLKPEGETQPQPSGVPRIEFDDVTYAYPAAGAPALAHLSLCIEPGEHVAVLGESGSGKSTLAKLLRGTLAPRSGHVRLRFPDGAALSATDADLLVGYVDQSPYLFNRTLRENLAMGKPGMEDERLEEALREVGLAERYESLELGLDTVIGETGTGFSGGESHRIAIARTLVAHTPIVVVDEPFAALDPETERSLLDTLLATCEGRTSIVITHHLAQIERFDRVVFVEDGRVGLSGSPAELAESSERFRSLVSFDRFGTQQ